MPEQSRQKRVLTSVLLVLCSISVNAAIMISPTVVPEPGGFEYSYQLTNVDSNPIVGFFLDAPANLSVSSSPSGWDGSVASSPDGSVANWITFDESFAIIPGTRLAGFALFSVSPPGTVSFFALDDQFSELTGQTIGPVASSVPEPRGLAVLTIALIGIYIRRTVR